MKFPSLQHLKEEAITAAFRFPMSLLCAFLGTGLAIYLVELDSVEQNLGLLHLLLTLALGIPLFFLIDIFAEKRELTMTQRGLTWIGTVGVLVLIYLSFPSENLPGNTRAPYIRYLVYNLALHLTVAFIPYLDRGQLTGFWNYNKALFIRLVVAVFFSNVISSGITMALGAISILFDVDFEPETYAHVFLLTLGIFNTWYFLAGIPVNFKAEAALETYPKGLKIFTQFILIPLLVIYLLILYFYGGKIILLWDWPRGIVAYLIIAISVLGIFTNLLLFPYQKEKEGGWIKGFYRAFYFLLVPLVVLLFIAIGIRIQEYGLTVNRYIIALMGVWLAFISGYFISGFKSIKTIPMSLAIVMMLSSFGPWGMFSLSERNQLVRLENILAENSILVDGKIKNQVTWELTSTGNPRPKSAKNRNSLDQKQLNQVNSIIQYLENYHGLEGLRPWLSEESFTVLETANQLELDRSKFIVESMGLTFVPEYEANLEGEFAISKSTFFRFELEKSEAIPLSGFDQMVPFVTHPDYGTGEQMEVLDGKDYSITKPVSIRENLVFTWKGTKVEFKTSEMVASLIEKNGPGENRTMTWEDLSLDQNSDGRAFRLIFKRLSFQAGDPEFERIEALSGIILIRENPTPE